MAIYSKHHKRLISRLARARKSLGLSQKDVAEALNHTQSYISKLESGQRKVDVVELNEIAKLYKRNINFFIS